MNNIAELRQSIVDELETAGAVSPYPADANEPDPRYKSYGVRAKAKKQIFAAHRRAIRAIPVPEQVELAAALIRSEFGEQQEIGLFILEKFPDYFLPEKFPLLDSLVRCLRGWSKVDSFTGSLLRNVLFLHPEAFLPLVQTWNGEQDMWLRRTSVVLFTRKVAKSGQFTDVALEMCDSLLIAEEDLVQKGVGWALKDLMKAEPERIKDYVHQLRQRGVSSTITRYAIKDLKGQERVDFLART